MAKAADQKHTGVAQRWAVLAEKRRAQLVALRNNGRWQRYYSEASLAAQIRDAEKCEAEWTRLAGVKPGPSA